MVRVESGYSSMIKANVGVRTLKKINIRETKTVSMAYDEAVQLIDIIAELDTYKERMDVETIMVCL